MMDEDKAFQDMLAHGTGFMLGGKHIPFEDTLIGLVEAVDRHLKGRDVGCTSDELLCRSADTLTAQAAKLAECERERDGRRESYNTIARLHIDGAGREDMLTASAEKLEAALRQYGDHVIRCEARFKDEPCTCGFTAALSANGDKP